MSETIDHDHFRLIVVAGEGLSGCFLSSDAIAYCVAKIRSSWSLKLPLVQADALPW